MAVSFALVAADAPTTVVVPAAEDVSAAFVVEDDPVTSLPTAPLALLMSAELAVADVPTTVVVPLADDVSLAFVLADVPVMVVVPLAEDVSAALVVADVPLEPPTAAGMRRMRRIYTNIPHSSPSGFAVIFSASESDTATPCP